MDDFRSEVQVMINLKPHPNIIMFVGACTLNELCLVTGKKFQRNFTEGVVEYCPSGSLDKYLKDNVNIPVEVKKKIIRGIATGMLHLVKVNYPIISLIGYIGRYYPQRSKCKKHSNRRILETKGKVQLELSS